MDFGELIKGIKELPDKHADYLVFSLLLDGTFNFTRIAELYTESLEKNKEKQSKKISNLMIPLSHYWIAYKGRTKHDKWIKSKAAHHLLPFFRTAGIEKDLKKWVEKNPYNRADDEEA